MAPKLEIAIAGAGIGGLAVATALRQDGHKVRVFDQFDAPAPVGSGLVVQPVGMDVLDSLGAGDAARAMGNRIFRMLGHDAGSDRRVLDVYYDAPGDPRFGLAIHRSALFQSLLDTALAADVELVAGHKVTGRDGTSLLFENKRLGPFDLIIDASGAGSPLTPMRAKALSYGALWSTVDWPDDTDLPYNELRQCYRGASHMVGVLPIGHMDGHARKKAAIFWSLPARDYATWRAAPLESWARAATDLWPEFRPFVSQIQTHDDMTMANYAHGTLSKPFRDGIVFIGDAAHRASPQLGQGANMALLDAAAFAGALRQSNGSLSNAIQLYTYARALHVRVYQMMSRVFTPQYQSDSLILPILRDRILFPVSTFGPIPGILTQLVCGDLLSPARGLTSSDPASG